MASIVLSRRLDQLGARLRMSASLLGVVVALGADAPEISSAVTAVKSGDHSLGLGIVLGSNMFNLAALLGLSALVAGSIKVGRRALLLNGGASLCVLALVTAQLAGVLAGVWALVLTVCVMVPYILLLAFSPREVWRWAEKLGLGRGTEDAKSQTEHDAKLPEESPQGSGVDLLGIVPALVSIVLGSVGMVHSASALGRHWRIDGAIVGAVILAGLTGIPNVVTAVRLALKRRGSAVLSEALNSNTFNLVAGVCLPTLLYSTQPLSHQGWLELWFLIGTTVGIIALALARGGLHRFGGILILAVYACFVAALFLHL